MTMLVRKRGVPARRGRHAATIAVPAALVLFVAANMPTHIRAVLRHPMLLGLLVWALAHLAANGDLASVVLFGGFAAFAVLAALSAAARGKNPPTDKAPRLAMDAAAGRASGSIAFGAGNSFAGSTSPPDEPKTLRFAASRRGVQRCRIRASAGVLDMWPDTGGRIASDVGVNPVTM